MAHHQHPNESTKSRLKAKNDPSKATNEGVCYVTPNATQRREIANLDVDTDNKDDGNTNKRES